MSAKKNENKKELKPRQPVVTVMGHVDHGKTSFLDAIRGTRVADKEAGGITQNTRAHEVTTKTGFKITFIDTPGHEAFSKMRERGSKVTDFVLLIVAADDGVQPQTKESINFAKKQNVPIIVAINKIDIKGINLQKIKTELSSFGVVIEEYGGDTLCFEISAKEKIGLEEVLSGIELLSTIHELKNVEPRALTYGEAFVLESSMDKKIGNVALCILKSGKLKGKEIGCSADQIFKVRAYLDANQKNINEVFESQSFWVTGLKTTIEAGEKIYFTESEENAKKFLVQKEESKEQEELSAESLFAGLLLKREEAKLGLDKKELNVIVKASTKGTLEAIIAKLTSLSSDTTKINILDSGTGDVTEAEIIRAKLAKGIVVTFQLPTPVSVTAIAQKEKVLIRNYEVIYEMFDEVQEVLNGMEEPITEEVEIAKAKVKKIFVLSDDSIVAGSEVVSGIILKGYKVKVVRSGNEIGRGKIQSVRSGKNEVKEVKKGLDCGIVIEPKVEGIEEGDEIIAYKVETY